MQLELAVRFGKTLVIQEVDGVDPVLYPLLRGDLISQGKITFFRLNLTQMEICFRFLFVCLVIEIGVLLNECLAVIIY